MIRLTCVALGCSLLLLAGCGGNEPKAEVEAKPNEKRPPVKIEGEGKLQEVWLQIDGMSKELNIT